MPGSSNFIRKRSSHASLWVLVGFLIILWISGGASRADVLGQAVVRFFAFSALLGFLLLSPRFEWRSVKPIALFLLFSGVLVAAQLIPLPPFVWMGLPGRELFIKAAEVSGQAQPWRPLSISPSATANALGSLIVPAAVIVLAAGLSRECHWRLLDAILLLILAGCVLALLQFSGARFENPFVNYISGSVSANFANRNHFALFVAIGCLLAPAWGFRGSHGNKWKGIFAISVLPFFFLTILATGSRAGFILGAIATVMGILIVRKDVWRALRVLPKTMAITLIAGVIGVFSAGIVLSIVLGRAVSVDRILGSDSADDLRAQALPYVFKAAGEYFPAGAGFGTFDAAYRIVEPDALLQVLYFNHAHSDWVEVVLDGGIAGAVLLVSALGWILTATVRAWRRDEKDKTLARIGSVILFMIMLASVVDYPARTPMIMSVVVIAALWLHNFSASTRSAAPSNTGPERTHEL